MRYVSNEEAAGILTPRRALECVRRAFEAKRNSLLPHKLHLPYTDGKFFNIMPAVMQHEGIMGAKLVTSISGRSSRVDADILLYNAESGELLAHMAAGFITAQRTGAVAALAVHKLARPGFRSLALAGLGACGMATLHCLAALYAEANLELRLLRYKDHAQQAIDSFSARTNWKFCMAESTQELFYGADVCISCLPQVQGLLATAEAFAPGCLVIPVHPYGFENCDTQFDRVVVDDKANAATLPGYRMFRNCTEMADILSHMVRGRKRDSERILCYCTGIALHDLMCAKYILEHLKAD